jgi:hypothetical protein
MAKTPRFSKESLMAEISKSPRFTPVSAMRKLSDKLPATPREAAAESEEEVQSPHTAPVYTPDGKSPRGKWHNDKKHVFEMGAPSDGQWQFSGLKSLDDIVEVIPPF